LVKAVRPTQVATGILQFFHKDWFMRRQTGSIAVAALIEPVVGFDMTCKCTRKINAHQHVEVGFIKVNDPETMNFRYSKILF
jgi:hypothetical protein